MIFMTRETGNKSRKLSRVLVVLHLYKNISPQLSNVRSAWGARASILPFVCMLMKVINNSLNSPWQQRKDL